MHSQHATQLATSAILHSHMVQGLKSNNLILHGWNLNFFLQGVKSELAHITGGKNILTLKTINKSLYPFKINYSLVEIFYYNNVKLK